MILEKFNKLIKQLSYDLQRPGELDEDIEIECRVERLCIMLTNLELLYPNARSLVSQLLDSTKSILGILRSENADCEKKCFQISINHLCTGKPGAPKLNTSLNMLMYYLGSGFTIPDVSAMLNVSCSTLKRRMKKYGIRKSNFYSLMKDDKLHKVIVSILKDFPNSGYKIKKGFLLSRGHRMQENKTRESMRRVDPEGVMLRTLQLRPVLRRAYQVAGALSLWHIDGNHKLIGYFHIL